MYSRHRDAIFINDGACNVRAIARALVKAEDDAQEDGIQPSQDEAVYLIIHQLAFLSGQEAINWGRWDHCRKICENVNADNAELVGAA